MDAGHVVATLGGRFDPAGFNAFGSAMYRARSDMESGEKRMTASQSRIAKSSHAMGQAVKIGAIGGIAGLGVAVGYSIKKAADFEQQLDSLGSVSGASGRQMAQLKKQAMDSGAATKYSALQAAQAQTELSKGGLSVSKILGGALKGALALASAGELDLADAATYTVNAMKLFKLGGDQATHVADALATAANQTTADVQDFGAALVQGGGAAKSAGYSFDQTITLLEALAEVGVKNSDAGTSMKTALLQLVGPTKKQAEASKDAGLSFLDQQGKMKSLTSISGMLRSKTADMTKAQRTALFQTLAGTDGFRTLLALYDAGPTKLAKLEQANKRQGVAADVAAVKQDNLKGKWENFTGSVETAAITVGDKFLPMLTRGAEQATDFLNHLSSTGQLDNFADGLVRGAHEGIEVVGELAHVVGDVAHAAAPAVGALSAIGRALDLGDPGHLEAVITAIAGFKIAGVVAPLVKELVTGVRMLATAPSVGALAGDLLAMVNPVTAVAIGVGALGAAIVLLASRESHEAQVARETAAAKREQKAAIDALHGAERDEVDKKLAAQRATIDLQTAEKNLSDVRKGGAKKSSLEYRQAEQDVAEATKRSADAHRDYETSLRKTKSGQDGVRTAAQKRLAVAGEELESAKKQAKAQAGAYGDHQQTAASLKRLETAQKAYNDAMLAFGDANKTANISSINVQRAQAGVAAISTKNAAAVQFLAAQLHGLPKDAKSKITLTGDQNVLAELGSLSARLASLGKTKTVARILASAGSAQSAVLAFKAILMGVPLSRVSKILAKTSGKAEVAALRAEIDRLQSKTVKIETQRINSIINKTEGGQSGGGGPRRRRAAGRGPSGTERSLIGEGKGPEWVVDPPRGSAYRVDAPIIADLSPTAYVLPTEDAYRGRSVGWLADIARDLGIAGYAKGKAPAHYRPSKKAATKAVRNLKVPERVTYAALPEDELKDDVDTARTNWKKRDKSIKSYEDKVRKDRAALKKADGIKGKGKKKAVTEARGKLDKDQTHLNALKNGGQGLRPAQNVYNTWREESALLKKLQAANREIERLNTVQETDRQKMANAAGAHDEVAYDAAQKDRTNTLNKLKTTYEKAVGLAKDGSKFKATLEGDLAGVIGDLQDASTTYDDASPDAKTEETEADRIADTGMTDAERGRLATLDKNIALAALTAPLDDDTTAASMKVDFLTGVLGELTSGHRAVGDDVIGDIADSLKSARDNLTSLTTGGTTTNDDADLQAQLDRANEDKRVSDENARINRQALETFGGSGDIGAGGVNARQAAAGGPTVVFQSYVPPSPGEALRLAAYTVGGMGYQSGRPSKIEKVG